MSVGLIPRAIEDRLKGLERDVFGLGMPWRGALNHEQLPQLTFGVRSVDDCELTVQHPAGSILGALEPTVFPGTTGADCHLQGKNRIDRDKLETALIAGVVKV
jgi:hypothetical protein